MEAQQLKERRLALSLTRQQLAVLLGCRIDHVYRWETGRLVIPPTTEPALEQIEIRLAKHKRQMHHKKSFMR